MKMKTNAGYKYRKIAGGYYLIPTGLAAEKSVVPLELTETAAWIWTHIEQGDSKEDIIPLMVEEFDTDIVHAGKAVNRFVKALLDQGMIMEDTDEKGHEQQ